MKGILERELFRIEALRLSSVEHFVADAEVSQQQTVDILLDQIGCGASEQQLGSSDAYLQLVEHRFDGPPPAVEQRQFHRRRAAMIEDGGDEPVLFALAGLELQRELDHAHWFAGSAAMDTEMSQVRSVCQLLERAEIERRLDTPEQVSARCNCLIPKFMAEEPTIGQTEHSLGQPRDHLARQRALTRRVCAGRHGEQDARSVLQQPYKAYLWIGRRTALGRRTAEALLIGIGVQCTKRGSIH